MEKRKIIVVIPTCNRPGYLNETLRSVLEPTRRYGHDVEVVIRDDSRGTPEGRKETFAELNEQLIGKLRGKYGIPIHYYPPGGKTPIEEVVEGMERRDKARAKRILEDAAPKWGYLGSKRNPLSLLAVYEGGVNAAYLHLDDDSPVLDVKDGRKVRQGNVLQLYLDGLEEANRNRKHGYSSTIKGARDAAVSLGFEKRSNATEVLKDPKVNRQEGDFSFAQGRILDFEAMQVPYHPNKIR